MSYILVTYGYNQFGLFNIKTSTPTLIDKIKETAFSEINQKLSKRDSQLTKEIESTINEAEKLKKVIASTEQDLQTEENKYQEAVRLLEEKKKKEEMEQKKNEAKATKGKAKKEEKKSPEKKKDNKKDKKVEEKEIDDTPIKVLKEKLEKLKTDLSTLGNNENIYNDKKAKLQNIIQLYKKKWKEKVGIKIDLVDSKGEKILIYSRGDTYANEYLVEKTCYELHSFNLPTVNPENEKDSKKNTKKDFKKKDEKKTEDKKTEDKKTEDKKTEDKKEEPAVELVLEPVKIDGYCFRSIKEDEELGEGTGTEKTKDKKAKKK